MSISVALVRFPLEKNKKFVVQVSTIRDFKPKTVQDYDPLKQYDVKWPILKREDSTSSTTDEDFPAYIILLGVDEKSLAYRATALGIKLPTSFRANFDAPSKRSGKRKSKTTSKDDPSKIKSKKIKKAITDAQALESEKRMKEIIQTHKGGAVIVNTVIAPVTSKQTQVIGKIMDITAGQNLFSQKSSDQRSPMKETASQDLFSKKSSDIRSPMKGTAGQDLFSKKSSDQRSPMKETASQDLFSKKSSDLKSPLKGTAGQDLFSKKSSDLKSPLKGTAGQDLFSKKSSDLKSPMKGTAGLNDPSLTEKSSDPKPSWLPDKLNDLKFKLNYGNKDDKPDEITSSQSERTEYSRRSFNNQVGTVESGESDIETVKASPYKPDISDSESGDWSSITSSADGKRKLLLLEVDDLRKKLASAQRESRQLKTELTSKSLQLEKWHETFKTFKELGMNILNYEATLKSPLKCPGFPCVSSNFSPRVGKWVVETQKVQHADNSSNAVKKLFNEPSAHFQINDMAAGSPLKGGSYASPLKPIILTPKKLIGSDSLRKGIPSPIKDTTRIKTSPTKGFARMPSPRKASIVPSPSKPLAKSSKKSKGQKKVIQELGPHEKCGKDLSTMILAALKKECPLQSDGKGNVHIGNNVYIRENAWKCNVAPSDIKISMAIKNLVGAIYTVKEGAALSLQGGTSPKTGANFKEAIPAGTLEAMFAVYRAKIMMEGVTSEKLLEAGVKDCARKYIRERLQEMHKSIRREQGKKNMEDEEKKNTEQEKKNT